MRFIVDSRVAKIAAIVLLGAAALAWGYRDSLIYRDSPLPHDVFASGVDFYDQWRAQSDSYNIVNSYIDEGQCDVLDMRGKLVYRFPPGFCYFFKDHSFLAVPGVIRYHDSTGQLAWALKAQTHHDIDVSPDEKEIFVINSAIVPFRGQTVQSDSIEGFDRGGQKIFDWQFTDHADELQRLIKLPELSHEIVNGTKDLREITHFNSIQVLPENSVAQKLPAFRKDNLLVNCYGNKVAFVIDRQTGAIVWAHFFAGSQTGTNSSLEKSGVHSIKLESNGKLLYFQNVIGYEYDQTRFSDIEEMDPITEQVVWRYRARPARDMLVTGWGCVQALSNGNMLVTSSGAGRAFEITRAGRLVWEWSNPMLDVNGLSKPVYRVLRVPKSRVDPVIRVWKTVNEPGAPSI